MDNNPMAYVQDSELDASQIKWLSELALFDFTIKYWASWSNNAVDALNWYPFHPLSSIQRNTESGRVEVISYFSVCMVVISYLKSTKIPDDLKSEHKLSAVLCSL